jgi:hypothetical protein
MALVGGQTPVVVGGNQPEYSGEPKIAYYTASSYAPSPYDPLLIKKVITRDESGKGIGNRLRIDVEVTKQDRTQEEIEDFYVYEFLDDSLHIDTNDSNASLINFKKLSSLEDIGELKDNLSRSDSYYSVNADIGDYTYAGNEPEVVYVSPRIISHGKYNWDNILNNDSTDRVEFLKLLREDFNIQWAKQENSTFYYIKNKTKETIFINNTDDYNEQIKLQIDDNINDTGKVEMKIDQTSYNLCIDNETVNGSRRLLLYDWNAILRLHINDFSSRDRLFYWYYIKPKKSGEFSTESVIRIMDDSRAGLPDITYPLNIKVFDPDLRFEVKPVLETNRVYADNFLYGLWPFKEKMKITYIIKFIGDASGTYKSRIKAKMDDFTDDYYYLGLSHKNLSLNLLDFSKNDYVSCNIVIAYNNTGIYQIPSIWVNGQLYDFDKTITVDTFLERYKADITFFIGILGFLLGLVLNKELKGLLKKIYNWFNRQRNRAEKTEPIDQEEMERREEAAKQISQLIIDAIERGSKKKQ